MALDATALVLSLGTIVAVLCAFLAVKSTSRDSNRPPLPPGPKGLPLLGNLNDLPKPGVLEAEHWLKLKKLYGPISSLSVLGQNLVIINDAEVAFELFEKRSVKYSSRPKQLFAGEMVGWENSLGLSPYNNRFRTYRKNMSRIIGSKHAAAQFEPLQEAEVARFLRRVLDDPESLLEHIRKETGAVILNIAYGYTAEPIKNDPLVDMAGDAMEKFGRAAVPGAFLVDVLPFLRYLPEWLPGAGFKKTARQWSSELLDVADKPYAFVKHQLAQGKNNISFLHRLLVAGDSDPEEKFTNKWSAMSLYAAGADTTVSSVACFYLAMMLYPEVQRKAQEEIDRVIGKGRLPGPADREQLPYVEAVVKETLRWHPVAPMGLPHASTEDDVYQGYFIPKNSLLFANVWHFTHDQDVYKDPMLFKPERFLADGGGEVEPDPRTFVFGFGRRICPGRLLADNALYLNIVQTLAVFDISKVAGHDPTVKFTPGVVSHPEPYSAQIKPRSSHHEHMIRSTETDYPFEQGDAQVLQSLET